MTVAGQVPTKEQTATGPKKATPKKATTKAVAKATKPEEKSDFTPTKAKALTDKIRKAADSTWEDIKKAYLGRIWLALDCKTWDEYVDKHYEGVPLSLPREKKKEAMQSLASAGLSSRAIAAATGVSQSTAARAVTDAAPKSAESNDSPPVIDIDPADITEVEGDEGRTVVGQDGKQYPATQKEGKAPINIVSVARGIAKSIELVRIDLDHLFSREDYEENQVDVQGTLEPQVSDLLDTLVGEFADLVSERASEPEPEPV